MPAPKVSQLYPRSKYHLMLFKLSNPYFRGTHIKHSINIYLSIWFCANRFLWGVKEIQPLVSGPELLIKMMADDDGA